MLPSFPVCYIAMSYNMLLVPGRKEVVIISKSEKQYSQAIICFFHEEYALLKTVVCGERLGAMG